MSAFILYKESDEKFFGSKSMIIDFFDNLSSGENVLGYCQTYFDGTQLKEGDLVIAMEKYENSFKLLALGSATSDYQYVTDGIMDDCVIDIKLDFIIGEHKDYTQFSSLLEENGIDLDALQRKEIKISDELAEKLLKRFASVYMSQECPDSGLAFNPKMDIKQLLCNYLNDYCPEFKKEVIKRFPLVYHNYNEGETIDRSLIDLTWDKSVKQFPARVLDWNYLFDIVRPRA